MGKMTDVLRKVAAERLARIEKRDSRSEVKYEFIAVKTVDSKIDPRIVAFYDQISPVSEQYRALRTNLQALSAKTQLKTLAITSSTHSEGKSITAINLAITLAHDLDNKRILLVDADMRRSSIGRYLGIKVEAGLADVISRDIKPEEAMVTVGINNLTILPAGKPPHNPAEILASAKMKKLLADLSRQYDYVVLDTPPVVAVTDAGIIGAMTDGMLIVVMANKTQKGVIAHMEVLLKHAQAKIVGYILTNIQYHIPEYIYRYL